MDLIEFFYNCMNTKMCDCIDGNCKYATVCEANKTYPMYILYADGEI